MELLDTPNPNAKKIVLDDNNNLNDQSLESDISDDLYRIDGVDSVFFGPGFITITKSEATDWESINQDIINIFDKL
jgi:hypothetical protein|tara:strand:+ start:361 stop:588 length:228 start_codon:yes stop_codon:yes gene_type:complete